MSRRWGMSIPWSSFPKEICFMVSGIDHPHAGENSPAPCHRDDFAMAGRSMHFLNCGTVSFVHSASMAKVRAWSPSSGRARGPPGSGSHPSLHLDDCALLLELGLERGRLVLRDASLDRLRCAVNQVLRFLQAETRDLTDDLDDLDLLRAGFLEGDGELRLLLDRRGGRSGAATTSSTANRGGRDGHVELALESLDQLGELEDRHVADRLENLVLAHGRVSHCHSPQSNPGDPGALVRLAVRCSESAGTPGKVQAPSRCVFSASSAPANMYNSPLSAPTKAAIGDCRPAPRSASICSREGIEASFFTCDSSIDTPSSSPPFTLGRASFSLAKSVRSFAAVTGSRLMTTPVGPLSVWLTRPLSFTARSASVFLMTTYSTPCRLRRRRSSVIRFTLRPVKSV